MFNFKTWVEKLKQITISISSIDTRSLATFRIGVSFLIILDLILRIPDLIAFYTDQGILPRFSLLQNYSNSARFSLYATSGEVWFVVLLFLIAFISAFSMLIRYRTRLATVVSWILLLSLHNRNELVLDGGDNLFHIVMFWAMFLPLGQTWSLDSLFFPKEKAKDNKIANVATLAILVQIAITFLFASILKTGSEWIPDLTASSIALKANYLGTPFAHFLLNYPDLLKVSTWLLFYIELVTPFLLFFPFKNWFFRIITLPVIILTLISFWLGLYIYIFPWVFIVSFILFTPSQFWDWLGRKAKSKEKLTFYYDEDCSFCTTAACALDNSLKTRTGQSTKETFAAMLEHDSFIIEDKNGKMFYKFDAILKVGESWPTTKWLVPAFKKGILYKLGNYFYDLIAKNRYKISLFVDWLKKPREIHIPEYIIQSIAAFLLIYIVIWNIGERFPDYKIPQPLDKIGWTLGLNQRWDMFAPHPVSVTGWFVIPGLLSNGTQVDVFNKTVGIANEAQTYSLPADMGSKGWRKYFTDALGNNNTKVQEQFSGYLCRRWNNEVDEDKPDKRLHTFEIFYISRVSLPNNEGYSQPTKVSLWQHRCY